MKNYIVAKITDEQWAEKLLNGEVFMRPLREFGTWSLNEHIDDEKLNNSFRGDCGEGVLEVYSDVNQDPRCYGLDSRVMKHVIATRTIDVGDLQYFKIFCMYALEIENGIPEKPSENLREFGDTAVVITDFDAFIRRVLRKHLEEDGEQLLVLLDRVEYYSLSDTKKLTPLFSKSEDYSWQNELRYAFAKLGNPSWEKEHTPGTGRMIIDTERKTLDIGDINDIAIKMSIDDFINLRFPEGFKARYALSTDEPCCVDLMIRDTKRAMKNYKVFGATTQMVIA